jgi:hypothetical protein
VPQTVSAFIENNLAQFGSIVADRFVSDDGTGSAGTVTVPPAIRSRR